MRKQVIDIGELSKVFGAFFAIMNPFVNLPIFLALTAEFTVAQQRALALKVTLFSALMCAVLLFAGQQIIAFFGITVDQFRVAGGIVLASIAWSMLNGNDSGAHHGSEAEKEGHKGLASLAFYPITFPMIVGPGTIATLIVYTGQASGTTEVLAVGGVLALVLGLLGLVLYFAAAFGKVLTGTMRVIMTRLMGMILLAISVEMVVVSLKAIFPILGGTGT